MASAATSPEGIYRTALESYLISMARRVESTLNRAIEALLHRDEQLASDIFLVEPRINEMEIIIDDHAVRLLRTRSSSDEEIRHIVAALKINNDLERMGDMAVNICQRVLCLSQMGETVLPTGLESMCVSVQAMVSRCLGALIHQNVALATEVLESEEIVDAYRDQLFESLLASMKMNVALVAPNVQFILATRHLERVADHATNIAEDVVFWLRGLDIRHGKAKCFIASDLAADLRLT